MPEHSLIWHNSSDGAPPCGPDALRDWVEFDLHGDRVRHGVSQVGSLAAVAASQAIERGRNITIAWAPGDPAAMPAAQLEAVFLGLRPLMLFCPEQPRRPDRWVFSSLGGSLQSLPQKAVQPLLSQTVETLYPRWQPRGENWSATALLVRHDTTALELGLIEPYQLTSDDIVALVADDLDVRQANRCSDPAVPASMAALVRARLEAQARLGIPPETRAPIYSSEVDALLLPVVGTVLNRHDIPAKLADLRRTLRKSYGDASEVVLEFALRSFVHGGRAIDDLRTAAKEAQAA